MKNNLVALVFATAVAVAPAAWAEGNIADVTDMQALRAAVRADKKALVVSVMALTDAEAKKFWPLYDGYQRGLDMANRERTRAIEILVGWDRGSLSDPLAKDLALDLLAADNMELKARTTLQVKLMRAIAPAKAARYLQLEAKIRALQAYDIAVTFPLVK
jgi:hypothetical protein